MEASDRTDEGWMPEFLFIREGGSDRSRERWSTSPLARQRRSFDVLRGSKPSKVALSMILPMRQRLEWPNNIPAVRQKLSPMQKAA